MNEVNIKLIGDEISVNLGNLSMSLSTGELMTLRNQITERLYERHTNRRHAANQRDEAELVTVGMAWLDEHYPDHPNTFDPDSFHIMCDDGKQCAVIMASCLGWGQAIEKHPELTHGGADAMGFTTSWASENENYAQFNERVERLNRAWINAYAARENS